MWLAVADKFFQLLNWLTGKADDKELDEERHTLSRVREAERKADEEDDTSGIESILRE